MIVENTSYQFFSPRRVFSKYSSGQMVPFSALWDFSEKDQKKGLFFLLGKKCFHVSGGFLLVIFGAEKLGKSLKLVPLQV